MQKNEYLLAFLLITGMELDFSHAWTSKRLMRVLDCATLPTFGTRSDSETSIIVVPTNDLTKPVINNFLDVENGSVSLWRRRDLLCRVSGVALGTVFSYVPAFADPVKEGTTFQRLTEDFCYEFQPPPDFIGPGQKPLKTHMDEVNFQSSKTLGFQIGITVDPVRISSLTDFGSPEQVAAKVVLAEVNRDGVLEVKLLEDPISGEIQNDNGTSALFYQLSYLSSGKRGNKRYVAKFFVQNQKLLALTAQCNEEDYATVQFPMITAVQSFHVI